MTWEDLAPGKCEQGKTQKRVYDLAKFLFCKARPRLCLSLLPLDTTPLLLGDIVFESS